MRRALSRSAARRLLRRRRRDALAKLADRAETIERELIGLKGDGDADRVALGRLETSLGAATLQARRLAARLASEPATFTEQRSDKDWDEVSAHPRAVAEGPKDADGMIAEEASVEFSEY